MLSKYTITIPFKYEFNRLEKNTLYRMMIDELKKSNNNRKRNNLIHSVILLVSHLNLI